MYTYTLYYAIAYNSGMGKIERESKKRKRKQDFQKAILGIVSTTAILTTALVAPNILKEFERLGILGSRRKEGINRARNKLIQSGLLEKDKNGYLIITNAGQTKLAEQKLSHYHIDKPKQWDGKWRIITFDIPERRKRIRDQIRQTLFHIGFVRLQDSVWVYPYNCEDLIALLKADMHIGKDMLYLIVDSIEGDTGLRKHFGLRT